MGTIHRSRHMKISVVVALSFSLPVVGCAATSDEEVGVSSAKLSSSNENSAIRYENESYEDAARRHEERFRKNHPNVRQDLAGTAQGNQVAVDKADLSKIPIWDDADIKTHFEKSRDLRFMTTSSRPSFQRRISWLYPDDGCFARAELVNAKAEEWGHTRPYRLFAFGNLTVQTNNSPSGHVNWWYHTVPVVKSASSQEVLVLDAAIDPKAPIPWKTWLLFQVSQLSDVKVAVCDGNTYVPSSACFGSSPPTSTAESDETDAYLQYEWDRQVTLDRDPNKVLGDAPPWIGAESALLAK